MLRIVQITGLISRKYGGLERFFLALAKECRNRGHRISFIWEETPHVEQFRNDLSETGAENIVIPARGKNFIFLRKFLSWTYRYKPDVIHSHFNPSSLLSLIVGKLLKIPVRILMIHSGLNLNEITQYSLMSKNCARWGQSLAHKVLYISKAVQEQYKIAFNAGKGQVHYLGIMNIAATRSRNEMRKELGLTPDDLVVACIAFHGPVKGVDILLRALAILTPSYPKLKLLQVGGSAITQETEDLHQLSRELQIDDRIVWAGYRNDISNVLSVGDIYCQPSRSEGLPLAILEAMGSELPVVATRVGGIPEAVLDGQTGILVDPESSEDLACVLSGLLDNGELRVQMGLAGKRRIDDKFDLGRQIGALVDIYEKNSAISGL